MKHFLALCLRGIAIILFGSSFVLGVLAYFVTGYNPATHEWADGLGRHVEPAPFLVRFIWQDRMWAGLGWMIIDSVVFFGAMWLTFGAYQLAERLSPTKLP